MSMLDNTCPQRRDFDMEGYYRRFQLRNRAANYKRFAKRQYKRLSRRTGCNTIRLELTAMLQPDPPTPVHLPYYPETNSLCRLLRAGESRYWSSDTPTNEDWACASIVEDYEYEVHWCDIETREEL